MTSEERRAAAKLGSLVLTSRIRKEQAAVAQDAAQEAAQSAVVGAVTVLPDFSSPAAIALFLASVTEKIDRREIGPAQANAMTAAAAAALRALELANEINLLSREVAVVRDRLAPAPNGWRRVR